MTVQFIKTPAGEELAVLPRAEYEVLVNEAAAGEAAEDAGMVRVLEKSEAALAEGREVELPAEVAKSIARGGSPIRALRKWRQMTQAELAERAGELGQGYLSDLENGRRRGSPDVLRRLADILGVPIDLLVD